MGIKLDRKDIIAIANDRAFRVNRRRFYFAMVIGAVLVVGGAFVYDSSQIGGCVLAGLGIAVFYGWLLVVDRRQKRERKKLLAEWEKEN